MKPFKTFENARDADPMDDGVPHGRRLLETCAGRSRQSGERCKRYPVPGRDFCNLHGGHTRQGAEHSNFRHGRYSRCLPAEMMRRFRTALTDPELLSLSPDIALVETQIALALEHVEPRAGLWQCASKLLGEMRVAASGGDGIVAAEKANELDRVLQRGLGSTKQWDSILHLIREKRKLALAEARRHQLLNQYITTEQGIVLVAALTAAIKRYVSDDETRRQVSQEFSRILGRTH